MNQVTKYHIRILLVLFLAFSANPHLDAQEEYHAVRKPVMHEAWDWTLSISPNYVDHPNAYPRVVGGINSMVFLGRYISLNANVAAGQGYLQFGSGLLGIPAILAGGTLMLTDGLGPDGFIVVAALLVLAFENINFHFPVNSNLEISPYFSLLRIKYIEEGYGISGSSWNANMVGGIRLNIFVSERFFIAPYTEATRDLGYGRKCIWGVNGGFHAGFYFRHR
ncbi:hypothetical protein ACFLTU_04440 [Bacteroidota bacterium]